MMTTYPILEYDADNEAMIDPQKLMKPRPDMPEHCVICFFFDVINHFAEQNLIRRITALRTEMGDHPIYELPYEGRSVALFHPGVGAPLAAGLMEEMIALGCRKFIACGGAGVLDREIAMGHVLIPVSAVRDEGTSYHYLPPSREVEPTPEAVAAIETVLQRHHVPYLLAKTWTTDAFYRETRKRVAMRRAEGCLTVDMEASALFAVAQFRGVQLGQILYGGDNLDGEVWDDRGWTEHWTVREKLIGLAAEACLLL
jgi:uridine phosphorylase